MAENSTGKVVQVIGPVLDVEFPADSVPEIYNALKLDDESGDVAIHLTAEVQQHIGRNQVRAVAMSTTDGVVRGMPVVDTGAPSGLPARSVTSCTVTVYVVNAASGSAGPTLDVVATPPAVVRSRCIRQHLFDPTDSQSAAAANV